MYKNHLTVAHALWRQLVRPSDHVIDATVGNGRDTIKLLALVPQGSVIGLDIQEAAIERAKKEIPEGKNLHLIAGSHEQFPSWIEKESIRLIVYNLGYLPGGDKSITTRVPTTLKSVEEALKLLCPGGLISVTCYPGHPEGEKEQEALLQWVKELRCSNSFGITHFQWPKGRSAPSIILIKKLVQQTN